MVPDPVGREVSNGWFAARVCQCLAPAGSGWGVLICLRPAWEAVCKAALGVAPHALRERREPRLCRAAVPAHDALFVADAIAVVAVRVGAEGTRTWWKALSAWRTDRTFSLDASDAKQYV